MHCSNLKAYNIMLTAYLSWAIVKNISMSGILFVSLYKFYRALLTLSAQFKIDKCNLFVHIMAFGFPIVSGIIYVICIFRFN